MSFFKKLKNDIGVDDEEKENKDKEVKVDSQENSEDNGKENKKKPEKKEKESKAQDWLNSQEGQLAVDVYQTPSEFCVQAAIAGVEPEDLDISIENDMLIIKGERKEPNNDQEKNYFYQECYWGPFSRQIILPEDIDANKIKASLKKGVLTIRIPRAVKIKKTKIEVEAE